MSVMSDVALSTGAATSPLADEDAPERVPAGLHPPRRSGRSTRMIGEVAVDLGFADRETVELAVKSARAQGRWTGLVLVEQGALRHDQLARVVAERFGLDYVDLGIYDVDMGAVTLLSAEAAKRYHAVPIGFGEAGELLLAMADPTNVLTIDDVGMMTGRRVRPVVASMEDLNLLLTRLVRLDESIEGIVEDQAEVEPQAEVQLEQVESDAPIIKLVHSIIAQAVQEGASDIHLNPEDGDAHVLFRVDGVLSEAATVKRTMVSGAVSRVKIMADLDISERRVPQDGRFALTLEGRRVDIRVVTLPLVHGEGVVMRILDKESIRLELDKLGFQEQELERFRRAFSNAYGCVLTTGPTGSGKSTSLYGALQELNTPEKNIITIEDPVEYQIGGITQVQVNNKAGLTFAAGLRSMMRADPDILMVGEIRDPETAQIAIEGALTGHMVLSTLHTNDAPSAITRLVEMGIEPFLVASAIDCVVAQRLARTLCAHCKKRTLIPAEVLRDHGFPAEFPIEAYEPGGCVRCGGMGYRGRIGLYEVMVMTEEIRALTLQRSSADQLGAAAVRGGMRRLREDGLDKVKHGLTSVAEIARVTGTGGGG